MKDRLTSLQEKIRRMTLDAVTCSEVQGSVRLEGDVRTLSDWLSCGYEAAGYYSHRVVNDTTICGQRPSEEAVANEKTRDLKSSSYDITIIGGGIIGCAIARELSKYDVSVCLIEKEVDVACHTTSRNDGMIHPGFAATPGSLKARLNVEGNRAYDEVCRDLHVPLHRPGSLLLFKTPLYRMLIPIMLQRAKKNGVDGDVRYLSRQEIREREPNVIDRQFGGIVFPSAGQLSPYGLTIAYAEHAVQNGLDILFDTSVIGFETDRDSVSAVITNNGSIRTKAVINAAGCWSDTIASLAGDHYFSLHFRKGAECILDKAKEFDQTMIIGMPELLKTRSTHSKGGGIVPCVEGNILIGPTAEEVFSRDDFSTHAQNFDRLDELMSLNLQLDRKDIITYFAGIRACSWHEDFIIERSPHRKNLIHAAGIQSPGLASAPAISKMVESLVQEVLPGLKRSTSYVPERKVPLEVQLLTHEEKRDVIEKNPEYGNIICHCEKISEGEIRDVLRSDLPPTTVDGVKRRTRAGSGRCHGSFCSPKVLSIMSEELGLPIEELEKKGHRSPIILGRTKGEGISHG